MISEKIILLCNAMAIESEVHNAQDAIMQLLRLNNQNSNCELTSFHIDTKQNNHFMIYEIWNNKQAWLEQLETDNVKTLQRDSNKLFLEYQLVNYSQIRDSVGIYKIGDLAALADKIALIGTLVANQGEANTVKKLLSAFLKCNREEAGCLFSAMHKNTANNHAFMVYEVWQNQAAWMNHLQQEHTGQFIEQLNEITRDMKMDIFSLVPVF